MAGTCLAPCLSCGASATSLGVTEAWVSLVDSEPAWRHRLWVAVGLALPSCRERPGRAAGGSTHCLHVNTRGCSSHGSQSFQDLVYSGALYPPDITQPLEHYSLQGFFLFSFSRLKTIVIFYWRFFWQRKEENVQPLLTWIGWNISQICVAFADSSERKLSKVLGKKARTLQYCKFESSFCYFQKKITIFILLFKVAFVLEFYFSIA